MKKLIVCIMIATFVLLCACSIEQQNHAMTTEGANTDTTQANLAHDDEWEGDIDLVDDTTEDNFEDDTAGGAENSTATTEGEGSANGGSSTGETEKPNEGGNVSCGIDNPVINDDPDVPEDTTEEEPFDPDLPIDVVDPADTTEPNLDQNGENPDDPNQRGSSGGSSDEPNQSGSSGGNSDEPNQSGSSGGNSDEPSQGGSSGGNTDEPAEGGNSDEPDEGGNSSRGGIELPIIPGWLFTEKRAHGF